MIQVSIFRTAGGTYQGFRLEGHAGYAEYGQDIVCAAISALVINTINSIEQFTTEDIVLKQDEKKGIIECRFKKGTSTDLISPESTLLIDSLLLGIKGIQDQYGTKYINLIL